MVSITKVEKDQKTGFNIMAKNYSIHYGDICSLKYRDAFVNDIMLNGLNLYNKKVLDAMCGSGETTHYLIKKGAIVTGLDISDTAISQFSSNFPQCDIKCCSILDTNFPSNSFDFIVILGGLHHVQPFVNEAINEIHRLLKVDGYFCFMEPHKGSIPNYARKLWYKYDKLFLPNEDAIDIDEINKVFSKKFLFIMEKYRGNFGWLLILNSMIFRIPLKIKPLYTPLVMWLESILNRIGGKLIQCCVVCQWKKL
tara:strand:+ start:1542 stop:2300 length:759 start_codon:yes stop_codon:yes gene_type:complete